MTMYAQTGLATNLSTLVSSIETQHEAIRGMERGTVAPTIKPNGMLWCRTDYPTIGESIVRWDGSAWTLLADPDHAQLNAGGTVVPTADLPMGSRKLTGLAAGSANGHSVRYEQVMLLSGVNVMTANLQMGGFTITGIGADLSMNSFKITDLAAPSANNDAARKIDVDNAGPARGIITDPGTTTHTVTLGFEPKRIQISMHNDGSTPKTLMPEVVFTDDVAVNTMATRVAFVQKSDGSTDTATIDLTRKSTGFEIDVNQGGSATNQLVWAAYR